MEDCLMFCKAAHLEWYTPGLPNSPLLFLLPLQVGENVRTLSEFIHHRKLCVYIYTTPIPR